MIQPTTDASWLQLAFSKPILVRSLMCGLVVGTILFTINHLDCCIAKGSISAVCLTKASLTATIPFLVSMISSVLAVKRGQ